MSKVNVEFFIDFEKEEDGRVIAEVPSLPGVMVYGGSHEEALRNVLVLAFRVIADRLEHGEEPHPEFDFVARLHSPVPEGQDLTLQIQPLKYEHEST